MNDQAPPEAFPLQSSQTDKTGWRCGIDSFENIIVSLAVATMVVIPLMESALRKLFQTGIEGSASIVQHLVLVVGMLGGAVAARESRLLKLSTVEESWLKGKWKSVSSAFTSAIGVAVSIGLCIAAFQFVVAEKPAEKILAYGVPVWMVEAVLPFGFALIALRILWHASQTWIGRASTTGLAAAILLLSTKIPASSNRVVLLSLIVIAVASILGVPAFVTLGGVALVLFRGDEQPIASIAIAHYSLVINPVLPTLPLFTLAGYFLAEGGSAKRLVRVFYALFGNFRGGPAIATVLVCAFFTSFTGASGVTILAVGGLLMPVLIGAKYSEKDALGLLTGAGSLGLLLPPCLPLILYAIVAHVPIQTMFLGSIVPAIVMIIATAIWGIRRGPKIEKVSQTFDWTEARYALWESKWELLMPVVASVALFGGFATPVEASAVTALYAILIATVLHRDLSFRRDIPRVMAECGLLIGGVLLILGVSLGFTNYLVDAEVPARLVNWTTVTIHSPLLFLLLLNIFLLVVGCLIEIYPAIVIEVPLLVPLGAAFGIDPVRLGIIFLANMELGYLTPPVGINLLMSSLRFKKPVPEILRATLPVILVLAIGVLLITYVPALTTAVPSLFGQ